jgi:hypothetical protein
LIVEYKHQDHRHQIHRKQPTFEKGAAFRTKDLNRKWPILMRIALSTKYFTLQMFLAGFYLTTRLLKITRGWEAEGLEKEAKVCFIHLISCFASSAPPSSTVPGPP